MDPRLVEEVSPVHELTRLVAEGDVAGIQAAVDKLLSKCGRQATSAHLTTCEFGERGSQSAVHLAAVRGRAEILRIFMQAGASPNARDDPGNTPLHHACERGHARAAYALLEAGANPDERSNFGKSPGHYLELNSWDKECTKEGKALISRMLEEGYKSIAFEDLPPEPSTQPPPPKPRAVGGDGPFGDAAMFGGVDPTLLAQLSGGAYPPLSQDMQYLHVEAEKGASAPPRRDGSVYSPSEVSTAATARDIDRGTGRLVSLHELVRRGDAEGVQQRINEAFAKFGREYAIGEAHNTEEDGAEDKRIIDSPLHIAANRGDVKIMQILLATRANPDHTNDVGDSLLHLAARGGQREVAELLIRHGANPGIMNNFGRTPDDHAEPNQWESSELREKKLGVRQSVRRSLQLSSPVSPSDVLVLGGEAELRSVKL